MSVALGPYTLSVDPDSTSKLYERIDTGFPERCGCLSCRNFIAARTQVYAEPVRELLEILGIPIGKEAEIYHSHRLINGDHHYGGWTHCVGELLAGFDAAPLPLTDRVAVWFHRRPSFVPAAFQGLSLVQLELEIQLPWLLPTPAPE